MAASDTSIPLLTLPAFVQALVARWKIGVAIVSACLLAGVVYLHVAPVKYTVQMQVIAVQDTSTSSSTLGAGQALLNQLSGGSGGAQRGNLELYLAALQSIDAADLLSRRPDILRHIFASEWTAEGWRQPPSMLRSVAQTVRQVLGLPLTPWQPPNPKRVEEFLQANIGIGRSISSPVVTISLSTTDPQFGVDFLNALNDSADGNLRRRTLSRVTSYIDYLNRRISQATVMEYRVSLADTIVQQERIRMAAASDAPYAADIFARPTASRFPSSPSPIVLLIALVMGLLLALCEQLARERWRFYRRFFRAQKAAA